MCKGQFSALPFPPSLRWKDGCRKPHNCATGVVRRPLISVPAKTSATSLSQGSVASASSTRSPLLLSLCRVMVDPVRFGFEERCYFGHVWRRWHLACFESDPVSLLCRKTEVRLFRLVHKYRRPLSRLARYKWQKSRVRFLVSYARQTPPRCPPVELCS
jgi:hypothetical protein